MLTKRTGSNQNPSEKMRTEIETNHLILARTSDLVSISKKSFSPGAFAFKLEYSENERKRKGRRLLRSFQRIQKIVENKSNGGTKCSWFVWKSPEKPGKKTGGTGDQRKN